MQFTANIAAVKEVKFNSSESSVSLTGQNTTAASQEDAESLGVFKLVVRDGILSLKDGLDANVDAVAASGDILLGASSDININGRVASVNGSVTVNSQASSTILSNEVSATLGHSVYWRIECQSAKRCQDYFRPRHLGPCVNKHHTDWRFEVDKRPNRSFWISGYDR